MPPTPNLQYPQIWRIFVSKCSINKAFTQRAHHKNHYGGLFFHHHIFNYLALIDLQKKVVW